MDGCLRFGADLVVWAAGTTWDAQTQEVVLSEGARIALGTPIVVDGDPLDDLAQSLSPEAVQAAQACGATGSPPGDPLPAGVVVRSFGGPA